MYECNPERVWCLEKFQKLRRKAVVKTISWHWKENREPRVGHTNVKVSPSLTRFRYSLSPSVIHIHCRVCIYLVYTRGDISRPCIGVLSTLYRIEDAYSLNDLFTGYNADSGAHYSCCFRNMVFLARTNSSPCISKTALTLYRGFPARPMPSKNASNAITTTVEAKWATRELR